MKAASIVRPQPFDNTSTRKKLCSANFLLQDLAYTLCEKMSRLSFKAFSIADPRSPDILQWLSNSSASVRSVDPRPLAFAFTGQGAQWRGMGRELLRYPVFANSLSDADLYLRGLGCKWSAMGKKAPRFGLIPTESDQTKYKKRITLNILSLYAQFYKLRWSNCFETGASVRFLWLAIPLER